MTDVSCGPAPPLSTLFQKTTHWFERAQAELLGNLPCRRGCSNCCVGLFPVTILDQQEIQRGMHELSPDRQMAIRQKSIQQISTIEAAVPRLARDRFLDHWPDREINDLVERTSDIPCPALDVEGHCAIYAFRPLVCRSMGIPAEETGAVYGACEVQTSVPLIRLSPLLRREEDLLAQEEAKQLAQAHQQRNSDGEELLLPYAFLPTGVSNGD